MSEISVIAPGATIGILGGGQLGRMLAVAASRLGYRCHIFEPQADCPASHVAAHTAAGYDDMAALDAFAAAVDVVTLEFENVPIAAVERWRGKYRSARAPPPWPWRRTARRRRPS